MKIVNVISIYYSKNMFYRFLINTKVEMTDKNITINLKPTRYSNWLTYRQQHNMLGIGQQFLLEQYVNKFCHLIRK